MLHLSLSPCLPVSPVNPVCLSAPSALSAPSVCLSAPVCLSVRPSCTIHHPFKPLTTISSQPRSLSITSRSSAGSGTPCFNMMPMGSGRLQRANWYACGSLRWGAGGGCAKEDNEDNEDDAAVMVVVQVVVVNPNYQNDRNNLRLHSSHTYQGVCQAHKLLTVSSGCNHHHHHHQQQQQLWGDSLRDC